MKLYRTKHFALMTLIWGTIGMLILASQFADSMLTDRGVHQTFYRFICFSTSFLVLIIGEIVYLKKASGLSWKTFLKTDFDRLAEDDRINSLENEIKHKCANVLITTSIFCALYLVGWKRQTVFSAKEILLLCGILMTVYYNLNYILVRKSYDSDTVDSLISKSNLIGILLAIIVLFLWSVLV